MSDFDVTLHEASLTYKAPDQKAMLLEAERAASTAAFIEIVDQDSLTFATAELNDMTKRLKELDKLRKSITAPMDQAKKAVMALFNPVTDSYKNSIAIIKDGIGRYTLEQERKAAEAAAEAEARAQAEREALEARAKESECEQEAAAIREAAAMIVADAPKAVSKAKGMSTSKKWRGKVVDLPAFLEFAAKHPELHACIEVKSGPLDRFIAATGGVVSIPGVEVSQEVIVSSRGG